MRRRGRTVVESHTTPNVTLQKQPPSPYDTPSPQQYSDVLLYERHDNQALIFVATTRTDEGRKEAYLKYDD